MAYRNDGRYCIDNSIAERLIRTLTIERKNKMAFGSHKVAETSTVYHTFIATCKMGALSFYQFSKNYLTAFMEGRTEYENLTPVILGKIDKKIAIICLVRANVRGINGFQITSVLIGCLQNNPNFDRLYKKTA